MFIKWFQDKGKYADIIKSYKINKEQKGLAFLFFFFLSLIYLSNLYTQYGPGTHDPEIRHCTLL